MAISPIDTLSNNLGKLLQISFSEGVRSQLSQDHRDWEMIKRFRVGAFPGRELRFLFQNSFGPGAVQYRAPNFSSTFPSAQRVTVSEHVAVAKELDATIEIEYNLWNRLMHAKDKYAQNQMALELQSKTTAYKRQLAKDLYGDGTGVIGTAASVVDDTSANTATVQLQTTNTARGHVGFFEYDDLLVGRTQAGVSVPPTVTGTFYAWRVKDRLRDTDKVVLEPIDSSFNVLPLTASNVVNNLVFYRLQQPTGGENALDLTAITSSTDYGTLTEVMVGLETLASADGRLVHGIQMNGPRAASEIDCGGQPIDVSFIQKVLDKTKIQVGEGVYNWKMMSMAPETHAAFIESRENDRRFISVDDNKRGIRYFAYQHRNDLVETYATEYVPKKRVYFLPETKAGAKVIEYYGTDFEPVKGPNMSSAHLKPAAGGGFERRVSMFWESLCCLIVKHPAAIGRLTNFTA